MAVAAVPRRNMIKKGENGGLLRVAEALSIVDVIGIIVVADNCSNPESQTN